MYKESVKIPPVETHTVNLEEGKSASQSGCSSDMSETDPKPNNCRPFLDISSDSNQEEEEPSYEDMSSDSDFVERRVNKPKKKKEKKKSKEEKSDDSKDKGPVSFSLPDRFASTRSIPGPKTSEGEKEDISEESEEGEPLSLAGPQGECPVSVRRQLVIAYFADQRKS